MASTIDYVEYLCEQLQDLGNMRFKKMFGDFMVYYNEKPIFLVCDNITYVKINDTTTDFFGSSQAKGFPYKGAREHYVVEDIDDKHYMQQLALLMETITAIPKKRVKTTQTK